MSLTVGDILKQYNRLGIAPPADLLAPVRKLPAAAVSADMTTEGTITALSVTIAMRTVSESNTRRGARSKMVRVKHQRGTVRSLLQRMPGLPPLPVSVHLVRLGRRKLDTFDNLPASLKASVDGCADAYGLPDSDPQFSWSCDQELVRSGFYVRIEISPREAAEGTEKI
jgi:hypothetical protein